jgi:anti-anti-sigma regulatory factor
LPDLYLEEVFEYRRLRIIPLGLHNPSDFDYLTLDGSSEAMVTVEETSISGDVSELLVRNRQVLLREAEILEQQFLVVDLSSVQFFGAKFAGLLVSTWDVLRRRDRRLVLTGLTPYCAALIKNLALDRLFEIRPKQQVTLEESGHGDANKKRIESIPGVQIEKTEVAWDPHMERWSYIDGDGCPIQTVIVPRPE